MPTSRRAADIEFELADGTRVTFPEQDLGGDDEIVDHATAKVIQHVLPGEKFGFTPHG